MINIPMWAKAPKNRNGVKATDNGWIDLKTGELLRKVPNLLARLEEVKKELAKEYLAQIEMIDRNFSDDFDVSELDDTVEQVQEQYDAPTSKELAENAEVVNFSEVRKEIHDEFMNEITKRENVGTVVTTKVEQTVANNTNVAVGQEVKQKRKYTRKVSVNTEEQKPRRKYTRREKKDETDAG
jgi:hypothetical protein